MTRLCGQSPDCARSTHSTEPGATTLALTVRVISVQVSGLDPRRVHAPAREVYSATWSVLNACASTARGASVVIAAARRTERRRS